MKRKRVPSTSRGRPRLVVSLVLAMGALPLAAQRAPSPTASTPRLQADERALTFAAAEASGSLDWEGTLDLALWASGATPASAENSRAAIHSAVAALREEVASLTGAASSPRSRAEYVLAFMHRRLLKSYSERQTRVDALVEAGRFNCVSSAALYAVLAAAVDLRVEGVSTVDHAFCAVHAGEELIDVETTSPYGFDPGSRIEFQDEFGRTTGFAYVSPRNYRQRQAISRLELLSLIFSNRIVELESAGRYAEAVGLALDRRALLAKDAAAARSEAELLDRLLNYGTSLARTGKEAEALSWAERAAAALGPHPRWDEFAAAAANNLLAKLVRTGRTAEARAEFTRLAPQLTDSSRRNLDRLVTDAELVRLIDAAGDKATTAAAVAAVGREVERGALAADRGRELSVYAQLRETERVARAEGWSAAIAAVDEAIAVSGRERKLEDARRVYRANRIAELHNTFAALYNAKRYPEAKEAALAALSEFPDDGRLRSDLATVERALSR